MPYEELRRQGRIREHPANSREIGRLLGLAARDLRVARTRISQSTRTGRLRHGRQRRATGFAGLHVQPRLPSSGGARSTPPSLVSQSLRRSRSRHSQRRRQRAALRLLPHPLRSALSGARPTRPTPFGPSPRTARGRDPIRRLIDPKPAGPPPALPTRPPAAPWPQAPPPA